MLTGSSHRALLFAIVMAIAITLPGGAIAAASATRWQSGDMRPVASTVVPSTLLQTDATPAPAATTLQIDDPVNGSTHSARRVTIRGRAIPNITIRRDKNGKDDKIKTNSDGTWEFKANLKLGSNHYRFYVDKHNDITTEIDLVYDPHFMITNPDAGTAISLATIVIHGTAPPNAELRHEKKGRDAKITADSTGAWFYSVKLKKGKNKFQFHLQDDKDRKAKIEIVLDPSLPQQDQPSTTDTTISTGPITVDGIRDGSTVTDKHLTIHGSAPANAEVHLALKDVDDPKFFADPSGHWLFDATLDSGVNTFEFFLQAQKDARITVSVTYDEVHDSTAVLAMTDPAADVTATSDRLIVRGTAAPHAEIHRQMDGPDDKIFADDVGNWQYEARLATGPNTLVFFLQEHQTVRVSRTVLYTPPPTSTPAPTSTPLPPTPTLPVEEQKAQYRNDLDVREVVKNLEAYKNWKLSYEGTVLSISANSEGTVIQLEVTYPGASEFDYEVIVIAFGPEVDTSGIFEDSQVAIWGRPQQYVTITNAFGGKVSQPGFVGDFIEKR